METTEIKTADGEEVEHGEAQMVFEEDGQRMRNKTGLQIRGGGRTEFISVSQTETFPEVGGPLFDSRIIQVPSISHSKECGSELKQIAFEGVTPFQKKTAEVLHFEEGFLKHTHTPPTTFVDDLQTADGNQGTVAVIQNDCQPLMDAVCPVAELTVETPCHNEAGKRTLHSYAHSDKQESMTASPLLHSSDLSLENGTQNDASFHKTTSLPQAPAQNCLIKPRGEDTAQERKIGKPVTSEALRQTEAPEKAVEMLQCEEEGLKLPSDILPSGPPATCFDQEQVTDGNGGALMAQNELQTVLDVMCPVTESSVETACQNGVAKRTSKDSDAHPAKAEGFITVSPILCASGLSLEDATKNDTSFHPTTTPLQQSPEENLIFEAKGEGTAEEKREDTARTPEAPTETPGISMTHASMDLIGEKEEIKPIPPDNLETNELKYLQSEVSSQLQRKVADESQSNFPTVIPEGVYPETKKSLPKMMKEQIMVESETEMYQKVAHTLKDRKENAYDQDKVTVKQDSEMVSKSIELDQKDRRCQEKKTESVENKRIEAALDVWEYSQAKDGSTEPNTSVDVKKPSQCKAETEMHLSKLLAVTQDGGEGTFPVCSRDNENVVDCQNIHHHGYKGHKTKKGCKAKKIALCPPEASVREFSNAYSDISADPLFVSEEAINLQSPTISSVFEEYEASTFIKEKLCKNVRPPKKKTKSKVIKGSGVEESLLAVNDDEAGVRAGGTAVAVSTPIPNHKKNKRGRPKKYTLIETSDVQKNTQTTSEAICRSFQQQDHHLSQLKFVPPLEIKTESERTFQTSKNVKKFKKQHLISSLSVRMAGNNTEQSVDTRIPDPANGVAIPQQVRSEIISISAHVDKGAQIEATEVKEKNREEGLAGLKISEPAKIIRRKRGRPLKKKTLAKMAKNLGFTELQQPGERDELKNDMSPHSSLPQKSHVKKMSKKIKKSLCPPENLRRYSRACKLTPVEKIQSGTKDFLQVQKQTISSSATVLSAQEVSSETKAFEIAGEQARKKRRPPKKKESSKPVKCQDQSQELMSTVQDGAVATAAIPSNKGFFSLQKEIHSDLDKTSVLPMKKNVKKPREQQSTSMISFPQVIESIRKNTDMKIMDTTISPVIPLQDENEFISTLPKEGKGEPCQKRKMKAIKGKITEPISVVGEGMKTGEGLAGLGVIGTVVKFKKKVGRPYKKKTLMKMAKHSGLTEGKGSGDRNASVVEDLKNDMLPPGIHSNLPQRSHVKKTGKKVNKALCPPVNVRRYSRACKLNPIEKTEECLAPEHNPLTLLATSDPTDLLQVQKEPISPSLNVLSVPVVSNETRGGEFVEQKPRKKGRPPKKKIDGAEAIAANPNNPVLLKPNKGNWRKKKVSQQSLNVSQQYFVPSSEIKRDVDGTSIQPMKKNVKKIRKQKLISMISFPEVVESTVNNTNTPTSLVIAPQGAYEIVSTLPQVDKGENCHKKKMKAIKEDTTEPTFVVGEHMETGEVLARPKTVGTVVKFKKKIGRPYKKTALKKTARELLCGEEQISNETDVCAGNQMKNVANNSPLEMSSHPIKVCKIKKETKKVKPASSPPITQLRRYSRECKVPSTDKTGDLSTHNLDQTIFLATPSSRDSPILPKIEASPSPAISVISSETNPCDFNDQKPHRRGRPSLKKKKPQECKSAGQGIQGLMLTVHEDVSLDNPNNSATGLDVLNPNSSISSNPPGHSHFLEKPCKEETGDNKVHKQNILNIAGNSFEQPTTNMFLSQAPFLPAEIQSNSDETFQTSILPMNNQKRHRKEKCDGRINPENVLENAEDSTDRSPNVANNVLISQGRCKTIDAAGEEALTNIKKVNTVKEGRSVVGDHSKGEEVLAILKNAKTFTELKRKRGRPYKKEKLIKMAKELSFTDEQRPDGMESARNELQSHILPQEILSHQGQVCNLKKTRKRVEIPCPPSSVTHLRRYHRACKVTTDYTFEKIKEHLAHNLDWSMVACPSDMLSSFSKMDTKQEFIGSEMVKPLEMDGQVPSQNTANISEMQSPTQEHSKKITLESTPLLNSLEQAEALEGTMPFSTILSSDTGMSPFQETVECNTMDSKKSQKVLPSKKMGRRRRRTWWDERGKAKLLLKKNQDTTLQTSQDEGRPETTTEEKIKDEQTDNSNNMHSLSDTTSVHGQEIVEFSSMDLLTKKAQRALRSKKKGRKRRRTWWDERGKAKLLLKKNQDTTLQFSQDEGRLETTTEEKIKDEQTDNSTNMHPLSNAALITGNETVDLNSMESGPQKPQKVPSCKKRGRKRRRTWWDERGKAKLLVKTSQNTTAQTSQGSDELPDTSGPKFCNNLTEKADGKMSVTEGQLDSDTNVEASEGLDMLPKIHCKSLESKDLEGQMDKDQEIDCIHVPNQNTTVLPTTHNAVEDAGAENDLQLDPENERKEASTLASLAESAVLSREQHVTKELISQEKPVKFMSDEEKGAVSFTADTFKHKQRRSKKSTSQEQVTEPRILRNRSQGGIQQVTHEANMTLRKMSQSCNDIPHAAVEKAEEGDIESPQSNMKLDTVTSVESESSIAEQRKSPEAPLSKNASSEALLNSPCADDPQVFSEFEDQSLIIKDVQADTSAIETIEPPFSDECSTQSSFSKSVNSQNERIVSKEVQEDRKSGWFEEADKGDANNFKKNPMEVMDKQISLICSSELAVPQQVSENGKCGTKCHFCKRSFRHIAAYIIHRRIHTGEKPYRCNECGKGFARLSQVNAHRKVHKLPGHLQCPFCTKRFSHRDKLLSHFLTHRNYLGLKNVIWESADNDAGIKTQTKTNTDHPGSASSVEHSKAFKCINCGKQFSQRSTLKKHKCIHTQDNAFPCKVCDKTFNQASNLSDHEKIHWPIKPYACSVCGKGYSRLRELRTHSRSHTGEKPFSCAHCGEAFRQLSRLRSHQVSKICLIEGADEDGNYSSIVDFLVHKDVDGQLKHPLALECQICRKSYNIQSEYNIHLLTHSDITPLGEAHGQQNSDHASQPRVCQTSQIQSDQPAQSLDHHKTFPLNNQQCEKDLPVQQETSEKYSNVQSQSISDSAQLPDVCASSPSDSKLVSTSTSRSISLNYQLLKSPKRLQACMLTNTTHYNYTCSRRGKALESWSKYWVHQRVHRQNVGGFCCPQCGQHFHFHGLYKEHMLEHAKQNPFACPLCPIAFADEEVLKEHQREEHGGCKPHKCHTCGKSFLHEGKLERHNLLHRGASLRSCSISNRPCPRSTIPQFHKCRECNATFKTLDLLRIHQLCHSTEDRNTGEEREIDNTVSGSLSPEQLQQSRTTPSPIPVSPPVSMCTPGQCDSLYDYPHPDNLYVYPTPSTSFPPPVLPSITNVHFYRNPSQMNSSNTYSHSCLNTSHSYKLSVPKKQNPPLNVNSTPHQSQPAQSLAPSPAILYSTAQLLKHPPQPHTSTPLQQSTKRMSLQYPRNQSSPSTQNNIHPRSNEKTNKDFCRVSPSYVKLKNKEDMQESFGCAECGTKFGVVSELYEHYIQHARGEV